MSEPVETPHKPFDRTKWKAAAEQRAAFRSSGDSGFYDQGAFTATFLVKIDGQEIGRFTEANGLEVSIDVEELEEGGNNSFVHKLPGRMTWPNLTLKRGVTETDNLMAWLNKCSGDGFAGAGNKLTRSTLGVTLMSADGKELRSWNFEGAFPVKWTGPTFASSSDDLAEEELEIAHNGLTVD